MDFKSLAREVRGTLTNEQFSSAVFQGISIDSRTVREKELFIAIRGDKNDGHDYIADALEKNSAGIMVSRDYSGIGEIASRVPTVTVNDTHRSMMQLATAYRKRQKTKSIAITGSNGKTTTKEFTYSIIRYKNKKTYRSPGNLNNEYGLPLSLFRMPQDSEFAVFELGISKPGEMTRLAQILQPEVAVITNVGPTHLETLGSVEMVAEAKFELIDALEGDKKVLLNADDPILMQAANRRNGFAYNTFGVKNNADFRAISAGFSTEGYPIVKIDDEMIFLKLFGEHQIYNILVGYAVCKMLGISCRPEELNEINYDFAPYRGEIERIHGMTVISDCYNANPASMKSGIISFKKYCESPELKSRRSIAVVGDMLELGSRSSEYHREIGKLLAECDFDLTITVGKHAGQIYESAREAGLGLNRVLHYETTGAAEKDILNNIRRGDIIYFKASRGLELEKVITLIRGAAFRQN